MLHEVDCILLLLTILHDDIAATYTGEAVFHFDGNDNYIENLQAVHLKVQYCCTYCTASVTVFRSNGFNHYQVKLSLQAAKLARIEL